MRPAATDDDDPGIDGESTWVEVEVAVAPHLVLQNRQISEPDTREERDLLANLSRRGQAVRDFARGFLDGCAALNVVGVPSEEEAAAGGSRRGRGGVVLVECHSNPNSLLKF